jgi:hypothetical protein
MATALLLSTIMAFVAFVTSLAALAYSRSKVIFQR